MLVIEVMIDPHDRGNPRADLCSAFPRYLEDVVPRLHSFLQQVLQGMILLFNLPDGWPRMANGKDMLDGYDDLTSKSEKMLCES